MNRFSLVLVAVGLAAMTAGCETGFVIGAHGKAFYPKDADPRTELYREGYTETTYPGHTQARGFIPLTTKTEAQQ